LVLLRYGGLLDDVLADELTAFEEPFTQLGRWLKMRKTGRAVAIDHAVMESLWRTAADYIYERRLREALERCFGCKLADLVRFGKRKLAFGFASEGVEVAVDTYRKGRLRRSDTLRPAPKTYVELLRGRRSRRAHPARDTIRLVYPPVPSGYPAELAGESVLSDVLAQIAQRLSPTVMREAYYLPAARSGILQAHRALAAGMVDMAPLVGTRRVAVPQLSGVVSDFISSILLLPSAKGPYHQLATEFEAELIGGRILARPEQEATYPQLYYEFQGREIPLHRSSSTVSELAPVFLYLKHIVAEQSLLFIEEPEAHLHPENQRRLARFLVRLLNAGLNLVITTHSELLLEQLNNHMLAGVLQRKPPGRDLAYSEEEVLKRDDVAVFAFSPDDSKGGYQIRAVPVDAKEGILEEEFLRVHEMLYEESFKLRRRAEGAPPA